MDEYDPDDGEMDHKNEIYQNYGVWHITLNTYLLNDLKLPFVHNVLGHEFSHACVGHIIALRSLIYDYMHHKSPQPHGPEFKRFCKLFKVSPELAKAKASAGRTSAKWNRTNGRHHKMWCCCETFYVGDATYKKLLDAPHECPDCDEVMLPYGLYDHPEEKTTETIHD